MEPTTNPESLPPHQAAYDDAMFAFTQGDYDDAILRLRQILLQDPSHFDAQLSLGMALCRKGDFAAAIAEGHKAEALRPREQLVHTNLSLFYMRAGDKKTAEHHGLQARIASWRGSMTPPTPGQNNPDEAELRIATPGQPKPVPTPDQFPEMPWKKKARITPPAGTP